jgi:hypothetical protein
LRALVERARQLTGAPGLGFYMGLEMRASNFGYLAFAAMCAASLREALELTIQFVAILALPVVGADRAALRLAGEHCKAALEALDCGGGHGGLPRGAELEHCFEP